MQGKLRYDLLDSTGAITNIVSLGYFLGGEIEHYVASGAIIGGQYLSRRLAGIEFSPMQNMVSSVIGGMAAHNLCPENDLYSSILFGAMFATNVTASLEKISGHLEDKLK